MDNFGRSTEMTYGCRRVKKECIDTIIGKSYVGDWFLFYLLGQNIDSVIFKVGKIIDRQKFLVFHSSLVNKSNSIFHLYSKAVRLSVKLFFTIKPTLTVWGTTSPQCQGCSPRPMENMLPPIPVIGREDRFDNWSTKLSMPPPMHWTAGINQTEEDT